MQGFGLFTNDLFTALAFAATASFRLHSQAVGHHDNGLIDVSGDLSIFMKTKCFGLRIKRQFLDVFNVVLLFSGFNDVVSATLTELVTYLNCFFADECFQDGTDQQ